ncbi:hypothetical protein PVAND_002656 [Polypedilum vanderplanki]|uniref:Histone-lysine N-methyltransferase 2C n=1 Tax=Polypedilum vanderplanki TaxID=319348 RepID=A0A9J6BT92_POLVA|nr:hypothetical protein PVAND_002656 [Polypedilum vanderplanki]
MDSAASFDDDNSDSDYMNVSSSSESSEENEFPAKRKNVPITKRRDGLDISKNPLSIIKSRLNIRQSTSQAAVKMCLKRKFSFTNATTTTTTKKENDGSGSSSSTINFQLISASSSSSQPQSQSQSPNDEQSMELESPSGSGIGNNLSTLMPAPMQGSDDPPYFPEKFPSKLCAFCNLGERSQLGQGEMLRLELSEEDSKNALKLKSQQSPQEDESKNGSDDLSKLLKNASSSTLLQQQLNRRQKGLNKCKNPVATNEYVDELEKIGYTEAMDLSLIVENGYYYVHRACAMWSFGVDRDPINEALSNVSTVLKQSLNRKCTHCNHYGASAVCKINCQKFFHFPCIAASGSFEDFQSCSVYCFDHLSQVAVNCGEEAYCRACCNLGDISNLMVCSKCGDHYHGACVGLAQQPGVRAGWQCKNCRSCQICRIPDNSDGRTLACETCDKLYHPQCLRPIMTTVPKYGWKCRCCRICSDCGARTPGAGASSRWHNHFTVCDSCYQQRNKGYSCPICRKAYRAAAYREMVKCSICQKFVHSTCDPEADLNAYERRKEVNPDYEYTCGMCKIATQNERVNLAMRRSNSGDDESLSASQESLDDIDMDIDGRMGSREDLALGLGKGKPMLASKIAKKKLGLNNTGGINSNNSGFGQRPKGIGKLGFQKRARTFELGRKRGPKSKMRGIFGVPGIGLQRPVAADSKQSDEEPGSENRLVLCSAKDRFVLTQDICVMCGAIGTDQEGCLISCAQCGQCYHPYCVTVKVTKEILQKGWRCLDCTVCEGCGEKNDEARLILCDDCDISYHIYCMEPPLTTVPQGTWKCKWCAICFKCGSNEAGNNCTWQNSYTECGPCASQSNCSVCSEIYADGELIIQCTNCDRWLHCLCDSIKNDTEAEKCAEEGYICLLCRPKDILAPHLQIKKKPPTLSTQSSTTTKEESIDENDNATILALEGSHFVDGVYLSEHGLQFIKTLQTEPKRAKRKPKVIQEAEKDAGILAAIESVVSGSADNSMEDIKMEPMDPNEEAQIYKDGMTWTNNEPAPEGFSLFTNESGQVILRKKRQRNLQKLGIGGFAVRNRAVRTTKNDEEPSNQCDDAKKKKPNRRKQKNKLIETYPTYLQEAFFGRPLMDSSLKVKLESSSSDEETKSNVSDDKTIKLSLDELKMIEAMRAKQQQKLQEEQKLLQVNVVNPLEQQQLMSNGAQIQLNQKMQSTDTTSVFNQNTTGSIASTSSSNINQTEIKTELELMDDDENNSDTEALKDVLGLPGDLLDNDLVNTIMNEDDDDLTKNTAGLDDVDVKGVKDDLADILSPHFNIDMEDMLFKSVLTDESQESQESQLTNSLTSYSTQSTPSHQSEVQPIHLNQPTNTSLQNNINQMQSPQQQPSTPTATIMNPMTLQPQSPQINTQLNPMNVMLQQQQQPNQMHQMQANMMQRQNSQPGTPIGLMPQQQQRGPQFNTANVFQNQPQWNANVDNDFDLVNMNAAASQATAVAGQPQKINNHQKNSERMSEDEKLGDMSTISAVLYANQNHPELKIEYPHWPDRYKQIMKKWRALSAERKQPYLQRARDNRSAQQAQQRTKKAQQVAPDLSPDNGTTSTNSTSPALSSTLSESSSLMDVSMIQQQHQSQQQQQVSTPTTVNVGPPQQLQVVRNNQQSPGRSSTPSSSSNLLPEHVLETNALDNKNDSTSPNNIKNNLLIIANEHKEFSCSIGDENISSPISNNSNNTINDKISESDEANLLLQVKSSSTSFDMSSKSDNNCSLLNKNANISVASNIANAFINLTTSLPKNNNNANNISNNNGSGSNNSNCLLNASGLSQTKNVNVIVSQQPLSAQHFMKTLSFTTSRGIFVPNVIATNIAPQFTVHQYGLHGASSSGPAPNVTVNPNGNFNTNSNPTLRPAIPNHFRLLLQQQNANINLNIINNNNNNQQQSNVNPSPAPSPILEASLQTITKEATMQATKTTVLPTKTIFPNQIIHPPQRSITPFTPIQQKIDQDHEMVQVEESSSLTNSTADQHIRVLTPSEIMKTLPSLSTHDNVCFNSSSMSTASIEKQSNETDINALSTNNNKKLQNASQHHHHDPNASGSVISILSNNSAISSPLTITTTTITSECNTFTSSHFTTITKATLSSTTSNNAQIIMDQDKIAAQQKSMKEAEQERQWKMLQAQRAREQQLGMPMDHQRMNDPNMQLQISTNLNDGSMSPVASPSPNSRNQFMAPNKGRMMMNPQSPSSSNFQHPGRPVSAQLQRQQSQRINQSPFSPQTGTPQSPNNIFPGSPSADGFQRQQSLDEQQFLHSPQTPKSIQQQSPVHTPTSANMSPVYSQVNQSQQQQQAPNIRPLDGVNAYAQAPGTPRPSFNPGQTRTTVYARPDMFNKPPFVQSNQNNPEQSNRQLRDLLQRSQAPTNLPGPTSSAFSMENDMMKNQQTLQTGTDNTFRQPLPPGIRQQRMQSMVGGQMIRAGQLTGTGQRMIMTPDNRPRLNIRPGMNMNVPQMMTDQHQQQQQMNQAGLNQTQRMPINQGTNFNPQNEMMQQSNMIQQNTPGQNMMMQQRLVASQNPSMQHALQGNQINPTQPNTTDQNVVHQQTGTDVEGIPDSVTAELEKLEQDENVGMDGVGDILGGLGDDDDDLLDSLTAEMGADFNILEYADPELDTTDEKSTLLDSLEMDEGENAKEEKLKNLEAEKIAKTNFPRTQQDMSNVQMQPNQQINRMQMQMTNINPQMQQSIDGQNVNQNAGPSQQQPAQIPQQQQQPGQVQNQQQMFQQANVQRQVRFKTIPPNQIPEIQQIHQQMMLQLQQAAANGKPMPIGTRLVANNNITGIVTGPNNISLTFPTGQQRLQQVRMVNPNMMQQNQQNNPRMALPHMVQNRPNMMQNAQQQQINPNIQGLINQTQQPQQQQAQQSQQVPPPPYPEPPPPYPGQANQNQEQPLLLEDLLEQEKREQARNIGTNQMDMNIPQNQQQQQSLFSDQDYEKLRADVLTTTTQSISMPQQIQQPQQVQVQPQQPQFAPRGIINKQWRPQTPGVVNSQAPSTSPDIVRSVPIFNANLTPMPPMPPEIIQTETDKQIQSNYEAWLITQNDSLQKQLHYYETEIAELRKLKKSLNTKQRQLKKNGGDLNEIDAQTLLKVTHEQAAVQKHLESSRKQARNHLQMKQDYDNKQKSKQMANISHMAQSPVGVQMNDQSPMMSPSPNIIQQPVQSPLGNPIMAPSQSPLHSPSPMMSSQSPGPNSIMQSPGGHINNAMSPYNTMQQSPRIGTPHSQIDESPFSPNSIESPSINSRLTSPIPRMTSPQHRPNTPMQIQMMNRMPVQFNQQQNMNMNQQNRFIRPQMIPNDSNSRMAGMRMPVQQFQQQMQHGGGNVIRQVQYDANGNPQNVQTISQANQQMDPQRAMQIRQMQMRQQQMMKQQQQQQQQQGQMQMQQMSQVQPNQSPIHQQPQSPLINQNATSPMPRSPMVHYQQQQQNPNSPMMQMDSSPRPMYAQQQQQNMQIEHSNNNSNLMQGGGGGGNHMMNPGNPTQKRAPIKLGLRGGMPMYGKDGNKKQTGTSDMLQLVQKAQQKHQAQQQSQQQGFTIEAQRNISGKVIPTAVSSMELQQASSSKQVKAKTSLLKNPLGPKVKSLVDYDDNDSSNGTPPISPISQKIRQRLQDGKMHNEDVVIVDSSPDEKQRLTDYDDDNDKITLTEVSLNSTAQDAGDAEIVEAFDGSELVSSPLVTEQEATDYTLFDSHVVHLDDSNESLKEIINTDLLFEDAIPVTKPSTSKIETSSSITATAKNPKNVGTREDFEAMIDSGKDEDENESESDAVTIEKNDPIEQETLEKPQGTPHRILTTTTIPTEGKREIKFPVVLSSSSGGQLITLPSNLMNRTNIQASALAATAGMTGGQKKIVKGSTQTLAKVSIGNTTISVPVVLKNMPITNSDPSQGAKKMITTNAQTLSSLKKNPNMFSVSGQKINTSTIVTLSLNKGNTRPIQTVDLKQRLQQNQKSIIVSAAPSGIIQASSHNVENIVSSATVINKLSASCASPILTFSKIPTYTMTQDTALPTKILEDDDVSPESSESDKNKVRDVSKSSESTSLSIPESGTVEGNEEVKETIIENKPKSLIPMHVIVKSRESSQSPIASSSSSTTTNPTHAQAQRIVSGNMSQLSPLSQPIEINTNTHNATQQIRSIMSSIDANEESKNKAEVEQVATSTQSSVPKTIIRSTSTPTSSGDTKIIISSQPSISVPSSPNTQSTNNVVFVKQIKAIPSSSSAGSTIAIKNQSTTTLAQQQQQPLIITKTTNLLNILSNPPSGQHQQTFKATEIKMEPPMSGDSIPKTVTILKSNPTITNLLNSNSFKRSKSSDDVITKETSEAAVNKRLSFEVSNEIKAEPIEPVVIKETVSTPTSVTTVVKTEQSITVTQASTPISQTQKIIPPNKPEDSQNVLLKQLLQNSGSGGPVGGSPLTRTVPGLITTQRAPSLGMFSSLEAQLARPVIPPAPAKQLIVTTQPLVTSIPIPVSSISSTPEATVKTSQSVSVSKSISIHETSFVSQPSASNILTTTTTTPPVASQTLNVSNIGEKKPIVILNRNDIPASLLTSNSSNMTKTIISPLTTTEGMAPPNMTIKKEMISPGGTIKPNQSPTHIAPTLVKSISQSSLNSGTTTPVPLESPSVDIKKEMDDSSQSESVASDVSMVKNENIMLTPSRDGMNEPLDESPAKTAAEIANELKKKKRREYQKNRRQMQMSKEKGVKKPRKLQKSEEDYDSFIDNLMLQIKSLPQMPILEPSLPKNYGVCQIYGSCELNKVNKKYDTTSGELTGVFGKGELSNISDFYNTKPFGVLEPKVEKTPASTQRGFYDQEFPPIKFDEEEKVTHHRSKYELLAKDRDIDTPDTVVSSSSPECVTMKPPNRFPGLRLIREEEDAETEDEMTSFIDNRMSPSIPTIIAPIPIRLKSGISLTSDNKVHNEKEFELSKQLGLKSCFEPPTPAKDNNNNNVTVTLTLTSSAAEDIMGVLKSLANILNIPAPTAYQIVERTTTPPSQKLGLYRIKGKDGKEGQPVDIQTILNGTAKFCRHCDVVILNNAIKAKANEFPLLVNTELESNELYFCGQTCYKQFQWRPINMLDDKSLNSTTDDKALETMSENISKVEMQGDLSQLRDQNRDLKRKHEEIEDMNESKEDILQAEKRQKLMRIKTFSANSFPNIHKQKKLSEREITEMLFRMNITVNSAPKILEDTRKCILCHQIGDGVADGPSRLLNYDVDKWVHLNCALWSDGVYETVNGALMNLEAALQQSLNSQCTHCNHLGATIKCFKPRCGTLYHLNCAMKDNCVFYKNKTTMCNIHAPKSEKDNELTTLSVQRRVYIERDENRQVASIMHHSDLTNLMRVGSLILLNVGQLLPHQLHTFHTANYIYPIGFKIIRFFWSMRYPNKRCHYICSIADSAGKPEFRVLVKEQNEEDTEFKDESPKKVWQKILETIVKLRRENQLVRVFPKYISGEDLFGLTEPAVVRILESLPGVETLNDYRFKYGRNPLLELPLAINPSGAARTEPRLKHSVPMKKPHTQRTGSTSQRPAFVPSTSAGEIACPYSKQFVHSKSSQYKKMKLEWRNNVFLARSKIQGLGLYAARDLEKHTMVIEYIGEVIRGELSELREKQYEARNRGIYMFRLDEDRVIDATLCGGLARYINHSCNPNCVTEIVEVDREYRIIIFAKRRINRGEELSYDYKFDIEDESRKIACHCGAAYCKKYMN